MLLQSEQQTSLLLAEQHTPGDNESLSHLTLNERFFSGLLRTKEPETHMLHSVVCSKKLQETTH